MEKQSEGLEFRCTHGTVGKPDFLCKLGSFITKNLSIPIGYNRETIFDQFVTCDENLATTETQDTLPKMQEHSDDDYGEEKEEEEEEKEPESKTSIIIFLKVGDTRIV